MTDRVVGYCSNDFDAGEDGGFANTPVDLTMRPRAKNKNSNAAIRQHAPPMRPLKQRAPANGMPRLRDLGRAFAPDETLTLSL